MMSGITAWGAYVPRPHLERSAIASAPSMKGLAKGRREYNGAAAAAFLVEEQGVAAELLGSSSSTTLLVDRYRAVCAYPGVAAVAVIGLH